jgi:1-acyl-sn-glycerol-3-phosphate acyltransferase
VLSSQAEEVVIAGPIVEPDMEPVARWWRRQLGRPEGEEGAWPGERLVVALARAYLGDLKLEDPSALEALKGRPVLYLANHETYLESVIFTVVMSMIGDLPVEALAKVEHQQAWLGRFHDLIIGWPGVKNPGAIVYFNQQNPAELPKLVRERCQHSSLLVHVEGTRQIVPGQPVEKISSLWVDIATERNVPIVPVAFRGGIGDGHKHDVPQGCARQAVFVGAPILPEQLAAKPYAERRKYVASRINELGQPAPIPVHQPVLEGRLQVDSPRFGPELAGIRAAIWGVEVVTQAERPLAPEWGKLLGI